MLREDKEKKILIGIFIETSIRRISEIRNLDGTDLYKESENKEIMKNNRNDEKSDYDGIKYIISDCQR
jgi:hypothetical protein